MAITVTLVSSHASSLQVPLNQLPGPRSQARHISSQDPSFASTRGSSVAFLAGGVISAYDFEE